MLSNKWTFSLTSFVVLIAFGLVMLCGTFCYGRRVISHTKHAFRPDGNRLDSS